MNHALTRRGALRRCALLGVGAGVGGLGGCASAPGEDPLLSEGFESGMEGWETGAHIGPEEDLSAFDHRVERSRDAAASGEWSLEVFTEGDHDDGTAWAVTSVDPPADATSVELSVQAWSEVESFNTMRYLVCYLGPAPPTAESDFPRPNTNTTGVAGASVGGLREPLHRAASWERYTAEWIPGTMPETLHVAVGVSVVWESDATHYVDDVRVTAE